MLATPEAADDVPAPVCFGFSCTTTTSSCWLLTTATSMSPGCVLDTYHTALLCPIVTSQTHSISTCMRSEVSFELELHLSDLCADGEARRARNRLDKNTLIMYFSKIQTPV